MDRCDAGRWLAESQPLDQALQFRRDAAGLAAIASDAIQQPGESALPVARQPPLGCAEGNTSPPRRAGQSDTIFQVGT